MGSQGGHQSSSHEHILKPTIIWFRCWESNLQCSDYNASAITTEPRSPDGKTQGKTQTKIQAKTILYEWSLIKWKLKTILDIAPEVMYEEIWVGSWNKETNKRTGANLKASENAIEWMTIDQVKIMDIQGGQDQNRIKLRPISPKLGFTDHMLLKPNCVLGLSKFLSNRKYFRFRKKSNGQP